MRSRIAIIGAGPIGIEAALHAAVQQCEVAVYERWRVGASLRDWGHIQLFSPWSMNVSPLGLSVLGKRDLPAPQDLLTGRELVSMYLEPLSRSAELDGKVHEGVAVVQVGRDGLAKHDFIRDPRRKASSFRLLLQESGGRERIAEAEILIDASGVWGNANYCGNGNIPAPGERRHADRISYRIEDFLEPTTAHRYAGARILVVGGGHSAATTIIGLSDLIVREPRTEVIWVTRSASELPFVLFPDDPLPFRAHVLREGNRIAVEGPGIRRLRATLVEAIDDGTKRALRVTLHAADGMVAEEVDYIIANCGFGPDNSLYRELQVHECWATRGLMKLSAALLGESSADCLAQTSHGPETLINPEPGFFIIGNKSYGKLSNFLLKIGREQIQEVFSMISQEKAGAIAPR